MMGAESVAYHRHTVLERADDHPGMALAYYASGARHRSNVGRSVRCRSVVSGPGGAADYEAVYGPGGAAIPGTRSAFVTDPPAGNGARDVGSQERGRASE